MEQEIIQEYLQGVSITKLIDKYKLSRRKITNILTDNNITIRGGRKKKTLSPQQLEEAKQMIQEGAFLKDLAKYFQLDTETMKLRLKEANLSITNTNRVNRRILSNYFSNIDSYEKAYWLGFLFTDGSVDHYKKTGRIRLQLQEKDIEILEQFKQSLQIDSKIIYDKRVNSTCCSVEFVDEQIFNDLGKYGIVPNKTYETNHILYKKVPEQYQTAFALGLFDGDGNFYCDDSFTDVTFGYTAYHESEVIDFQELITKITNINTSNKPYFTSAWHVQWRGRQQVLKILDILYKDCSIHLARKYNKYLALKNSLN